MKNGKAIKTMPITMIRNTLEIKYGKTHSAIPDRRAMARRCFFPYTKYPNPIEPNNIPHIIDVVLPIIFLSFSQCRRTLDYPTKVPISSAPIESLSDTSPSPVGFAIRKDLMR